MIKVDEETLDKMEAQHPGIRESIASFEAAVLPSCPTCGSADTAAVGVGIVGRSIYIVSATSKYSIVPNSPKPGNYRCNVCRKYFK